MAHQILALRPAEVWFERGLRAKSVADIFANPESFIQSVPLSERYNVYYTICECLEEKGRKLSSQKYIPFDIDGLLIEKVDTAQLENIARIVCQTINVPYEDCGVLFSGNGIQIVVEIKTPIIEEEYFNKVRRHYGGVCDQIDLALGKAGIHGRADRAVWSTARLMRYPETINKKPGKPERRGIILNRTIKETDFDLVKASKLPVIDAKSQLESKTLRGYTPDTKAIMQECKFLKWAQTNPEKVSESEWYASLSITGRFDNGRDFSHQFSKGHPKYSFEETEKKIDQALEASNPRTCKNINQVSGGKCVGCKHHNTGMTSPILITGPDHIRTKNTGFHNVVFTEDGKMKPGKPNYADLRKQFILDYGEYVSIEDASTIRAWNGTHYVDISRDKIRSYAMLKFDPSNKVTLRLEFEDFIKLQNLVSPNFFAVSTTGKMNFLNGVVDVPTGELLPHSKEFGFRSVLNCKYDPEAKAPRFMQFLNEVTLNRPSLINVLQEFIGYTLANGDCKHQKILILLGSGENGKSIFVELLRILVGKDGSSSLSIKNMSDPQNRYIMEGKVVNIAEENSADSFRDAEFVKGFARGGVVTVKKLYAQPYEYVNRTKLIMLCNEVPYTKDNTHGFFRSFIMIPFENKFSYDLGNKDPDILMKLSVELPGIFNWAMEGYKRLVSQNRFSECPESDALIVDYKKDSNSFIQWREDNISYDEDKDKFINRSELYLDYVNYCKDNGERFPYSSKKFFAMVREYIKSNGGKPVECRRRFANTNAWTINHVKHHSLQQF